MPVLHYESGEGAGRKVDFHDSVVVGRLKTNAIPIPDAEASREHTRIVREPDGWYAVDCGSRNGTDVNGAKITRHRLVTGDRIRIGKSVLRFEDAVSAAPAAPALPPPMPVQAPVALSSPPRPLPSAVHSHGGHTRAAPPSSGAKMAVYALLVVFFVGLVFVSRWIAGMAIDRMVESQKQGQGK